MDFVSTEEMCDVYTEEIVDKIKVLKCHSHFAVYFWYSFDMLDGTDLFLVWHLNFSQ